MLLVFGGFLVLLVLSKRLKLIERRVAKMANNRGGEVKSSFADDAGRKRRRVEEYILIRDRGC